MIIVSTTASTATLSSKSPRYAPVFPIEMATDLLTVAKTPAKDRRLKHFQYKLQPCFNLLLKAILEGR